MVEFMEQIDRDPTRDRVIVWGNREFYLGVGRVVVLGAMVLLTAFFLRNPADLVDLLPILSLGAFAYLGVASVRGGSTAHGLPPHPAERSPVPNDS